jgi:hypothetical protein
MRLTARWQMHVFTAAEIHTTFEDWIVLQPVQQMMAQEHV